MAVLAPIPSASDKMATAVKMGFLRSPRQRHPLPHSLRILPHRTRQFRIKPHRSYNLCAPLAARDSVKPPKIFQILHPAHLVIEKRRMRHIPHLLADIVKFARPENRDLAARWLIQPRQRAQQRSLARAVVPKNGIELSARKFRGNPAQRRKTAKLLDQVRNCDDGGGGGSVFSQRN